MMGHKSLVPKTNRGYLPLPATFGNVKEPRKKNVIIVLVMVLVMLWFNPWGVSLNIFNNTPFLQYPAPHPYTSDHIITTNSKYIFPPIEHAPLLNELGKKKLVKESRIRDASHPEIDVSQIFSLNIYDDPDMAVQMAKEKEENAALDLSTAKNAFKNQDKIVYKPKHLKNYPPVIIVSAVDFEKYSVKSLITLVQNRIDYAHEHNYGVYIRWYQEFLPWIDSFANFANSEKRKWIRIHCLKAALLAFPNAEWFWYLDEDGLIMEQFIDLKQYVLSHEALSPIILREQPINPQNGLIKTYKSSKPNNIRLIITQSDEKIETDSFILRNDDVGRAMLEYWGTDLFFDYPNFPYGPDSALTHILQWHPFLLSKTAIIPARTIAAKHFPEKLQQDDHLHYVKGDLAVSWADCKKEQCEATLSYYNSILHPPPKSDV